MEWDAVVMLVQLRMLLERMVDPSDPITHEQIALFLSRPTGPILPNGCVRAERLPSRYRLRRVETHTVPPRLEMVDDLAVSPTGELWVATIVEGCSVLMRHGDIRGRRSGTERLVLQLMDDDDDGTRFVPRILGFQPDGTPIAACAKITSSSGSAHWAEDCFLFIGDHRVFVEQLPRIGLRAVRATQQGDVLTVHENLAAEHGARCEVFRNGERVLVEGCVHDVFALEGGTMVATIGLPGLLGVVPPPGERPLCIVIADNERAVTIVTVRGRVGDVMLTHISDRGVVVQRHVDLRDPRVAADQQTIGSVKYVAHDLQLPDGRWCYVGTAHGFQCMVVDGTAGPGFDRVSNAFMDGIVPHYYSVMGQYLFLMEISSNKKAE
ncbi:MAG: hypothetical protein Q7T01_00770 [bacterium]|nr:hypothetical protein [bacterium]